MEVKRRKVVVIERDLGSCLSSIKKIPYFKGSVCLSVPCVLGENGIEGINDTKLSKAFKASVDVIHNLLRNTLE